MTNNFRILVNGWTIDKARSKEDAISKAKAVIAAGSEAAIKVFDRFNHTVWEN